jgi:hypothetical protein
MLRTSWFVPAGDGDVGAGASGFARQQQAGFDATGRQQHFRTPLAHSSTALGRVPQALFDAPLPSKTLTRVSSFVHWLGVFGWPIVIVPAGRSV